ncbi:MAG TPA: tetratricopeptide repeat protein [Pyrinomonadaceae bacterium]
MKKHLTQMLGWATPLMQISALTLISVIGGAKAAPALRQIMASSNSSQGKQAPELVADGAAALERGDTQAAKALFERALTIDKNNVEADTYLGVIADRAGDLLEAERHFAAAAIAAPLSPSARNNHGAILLKLGRTKQAAAQFETSLRLDRNQPSALINLAQIRFASGTSEDLHAALDLFKRAQSIAPDLDVARSLVVTALRLGQRDDALTYYRDYAVRLSGAQGESVAPAARAELGAALLEAKLTEEAIKELSAAVAVDQKNVEAIVNLAKAYHAANDINSAGRLLETAVANGLDDARIYAALADVYESIGRAENAIPAMRLAIERDPQNEGYRFRYALLLIDTKAPKAAVIRLQEAMSLFPNSARLWFALGVAQFSDQQTDEAAKAFSRAIEIDQRAAPALAYLGMIDAEQGRFADAITLYERAIGANEQFAAAHYLLADVLMKQATIDVARTELHLKRALQLDPTLIQAHLALGKLYLRDEHLSEAASELETAIKADPNLAEAYYQLGRTYMRLKRTAEAQTTLAAFKRLSDSQKEQSETERREMVRRLANVRF